MGTAGVAAHVFYELLAGVAMPFASRLGPRTAAAFWASSTVAAYHHAGRQPSSRDTVFSALNGRYLSAVIAHFLAWPRTTRMGLPWLTECEGLTGAVIAPYNVILHASGIAAIGGLAENRRAGAWVRWSPWWPCSGCSGSSGGSSTVSSSRPGTILAGGTAGSEAGEGTPEQVQVHVPRRDREGVVRVQPYLRLKTPGGRGFLVNRAQSEAGTQRGQAITAGSTEQLIEKILDAQQVLGLDRFFGQIDWGGLPKALVQESSPATPPRSPRWYAAELPRPRDDGPGSGHRSETHARLLSRTAVGYVLDSRRHQDPLVTRHADRRPSPLALSVRRATSDDVRVAGQYRTPPPPGELLVGGRPRRGARVPSNTQTAPW